ncbi:hypothetical protein ACOSQ3_017228 [Xanthoceras sorbifolium]
MSTEGPSDTPSSSSKRKGRGPNQINFNKIAKAKEARFGLDDVGKSNVFNSMNTCWRQYKSRLTKRIRELSSGPEAGRMIQLLKPTNITDEDWSQFVSNRLSSEFDIISSKYSDLAKKNKAPHTTSRKGLARLREDLKQLEEISGNQATSISDDAVSQVLGKEHRGRVRGLGGGVTPTRVNASVVGKQTTTQLREEMKKQNKRHEDEMKRQQDEMNALKQQLKDLQSFVFNMQRREKRRESCCSAEGEEGGSASRRDKYEGREERESSWPGKKKEQKLNEMEASSQKGKKCKLLHWIDSGEVVAEAEIECIDPQVSVHHVALDLDHWKITVKKILVSKVPLCRPTSDLHMLEDSRGTYIAWSSKYITY